MNKALRAMLIFQAVAIAAFAAWWLWPEPGADTPEAAFTQLLEAVRERGAAPAVGALGRPVVEGAELICNREVCIAERYGGQEARWALATSSSGEDACASYHHPDCAPAKVRERLARLLRYTQTPGCRVESVVRNGPRRGLRVRCGAISDFVKLKKDANGWRLAPSERAPGFLPEVYRRLEP